MNEKTLFEEYAKTYQRTMSGIKAFMPKPIKVELEATINQAFYLSGMYKASEMMGVSAETLSKIKMGNDVISGKIAEMESAVNGGE